MNSNARLWTPRKVTWSNKWINTLGVDLYNTPEDRDGNILSVINKMNAVSNLWYYRSMTLIGKITVINSLMASLFVYRMQVLPILNERLITQVKDIMKEFLWKGKREKIPLSTLTLNKDEGGLGLVNIRMKHEALLCNWIVDCKKFDSIRNLARYFLGSFVEDGSIWQFNLNVQDSEKLFPGNSFWHKLLHKWHGYNFHTPLSAASVEKERFEFNTHIRIRGKPITRKLNKVEQINVSLKVIWSDGQFKRYNAVKESLAVSWLEYMSLIAAVPEEWKELLRTSVAGYQMTKEESI